MATGLTRGSQRVFGMISNIVTRSISLEIKSENNDRSNRLDWKAASALATIFTDQPSDAARVGGGVPLTGTISVKLTDTYKDLDGTAAYLVASIISPFYPDGSANDNPSVILAITEWIVEQVGNLSIGAWFHPTVTLGAADGMPDGDGVYTFTFTLVGSTTTNDALKTALSQQTASDGLFGVILYKKEGIHVGDVFKDYELHFDTTQPVVTERTTTWTSALSFPLHNSDPYTIAYYRPRCAYTASEFVSPLHRLSTPAGNTRPVNGYTTASGQPWAVATVYKFDTAGLRLTLFALSNGPEVDSDPVVWQRNGIWLGVEDNKVHLKVGNWSGKNLELTHNSNTLGRNQWTGLVLMWNGHQSDAMTDDDAKAAYSLKLVNLQTMAVTSLSWHLVNLTDSGGSHAFPANADRIGETDTHLDYLYLVGSGGFEMFGNSQVGTQMFRGIIASNTCTTLLDNAELPSDTELALMVANPLRWVETHKVGKRFRFPGVTQTPGDSEPFSASVVGETATNIWLMGDHGGYIDVPNPNGALGLLVNSLTDGFNPSAAEILADWSGHFGSLLILGNFTPTEIVSVGEAFVGTH
jgi:hypothetical protein